MLKTLKRIATGIGICSVLLGGYAFGHENKELPQARVKIEHTSDIDSNGIQTTIGFNPSGYDKPVPTDTQFGETFRVYDAVNVEDGEVEHTTALGLKSPRFNVNDIENGIILFGVLGDEEGIGLESEHTYRNLNLILNLENASKPEDESRVGFGLDYTILKNLCLGVGFDRAEDIDQYLANVSYDLDENNLFGFAYANRSNSENSASCVWLRHGDVHWGVRFRNKVTWDEDIKKYEGEFILAEGITSGRGGALWTIARNAGDYAWHNRSVIPLSVSKTEDTLVPDRTYEGWAFVAKGEYEDGNSYARADIGRTFAKDVLGGKLGVSLGGIYTFEDKRVGPSTILVYRKGRLCFENQFSVKNGEVNIKTGLQWKF